MKSVLISIRPQWVDLIARGVKTIEVRKTRPNMSTPFKCYIYSTKGSKAYIVDNSFHMDYGCVANGKVVGEFVCDNITNVLSDSKFWLDEKITRQTLLTGNEIRIYAGGSKKLYGWHISSLQIYDQPKDLSTFIPTCKYMQIDGTCNHRKVECMYQDTDYNPDGGINMVCCGNMVNRAPQSWCYVEELKNDE